jgi:Holliday junction resolvase
MNHIQKGKLAEKEFGNILEEAGYEVYLVPKSNRWVKSKDIWGMFDIIATSPGELLGVQVKCNKTDGAIKQLKDWRHHPYWLKKMVAVRHDDGTWRRILI